jgi:hypothetical protein
MSTPLPDAVSVLLRTSATAAMGALLLISVSHRELFDWASRMIGGDEPAKEEPRPNGNAKQARRAQNTPFHWKRPRKRNGASRPAKAKRSGAAAYHARRREARARDDQALLEIMRANPEGSIGDWAMTIGKGRSSVVSALHRLRDANLVESAGGKWRLTEEPAPREPTPKWTAPLSGTHRAHAHA